MTGGDINVQLRSRDANIFSMVRNEPRWLCELFNFEVQGTSFFRLLLPLYSYHTSFPIKEGKETSFNINKSGEVAQG